MAPVSLCCSRRRVLLRGATTLFALVTMAMGPQARAKAAKADFQYRERPHNGATCSQCKLFSPDAANPSSGTCAILEGPVSPNGWCIAFSAKA